MFLAAIVASKKQSKIIIEATYQCLIEHRLTQFLPIQPKDDSSQRCSLVTSNEFSRLREVLGSGKSADAKAKAVGLRICLDWSSLKDKEP